MMYKFLVALFLLYVPASTSAFAHSGTDQEEKACTRDVQRFCRKLMDQGDLPFWLASRKIVQSFLPRAATCWSVTGNSGRSIKEERSCLDRIQKSAPSNAAQR